MQPYDQRLDFHEHRPRAFDGRKNGTAGHWFVAAREEQHGRIVHLFQPFPRHGEDTDFVDGAEAVLERAQNPVLMAALPFETHHDVDHVFEHAGPRNAAILRHMTDEHKSDTVFLRVADQFECTATDLADRSRRPFDRVGMHRLDRIDHQQTRCIHRTQCRENIAHTGRRCQLYRGIGETQPRRAHAHLTRCFFAADVNDPAPFPGDPCCRLQQKGGFSDARIPAEQDRRTRNEPATQGAVEFGQAGGLPHGKRSRLVQFDKLDCPPPTRKIVFHREDGRRGIFHQRIPFCAVGTLPLPAMGDTATGLADIAFLRLCHEPS